MLPFRGPPPPRGFPGAPPPPLAGMGMPPMMRPPPMGIVGMPPPHAMLAPPPMLFPPRPILAQPPPPGVTPTVPLGPPGVTPAAGPPGVTPAAPSMPIKTSASATSSSTTPSTGTKDAKDTAATTSTGKEGASGRDAGPTHVFVGKLPTDLHDSCIRQLLEQCGTVVTWKRTIDPVSGDAMGFGFATFATERAILRALRLLDGFAIPDAQALVVKVDTKVRPQLERVAAAGMSEQMTRSELARDAVVLKKLQQLVANYAKRRKRRRASSSTAVQGEVATAQTAETAKSGNGDDGTGVNEQAASTATGDIVDKTDKASADAPVVSSTELNDSDEASKDARTDDVPGSRENPLTGETVETAMPRQCEQQEDNGEERQLPGTEPHTSADQQDAAVATSQDKANSAQQSERDALGRAVRTRHDEGESRDRGRNSSRRSRDRSRERDDRDDRTRQRTRERDHERSRKRRDRSRSHERSSRRHRSRRYRSVSRSRSRSRRDHRHHRSDRDRDRESERRSRRRRHREASSSSSDDEHSDDNEQQQQRRIKRQRRESTATVSSDDAHEPEHPRDSVATTVINGNRGDGVLKDAPTTVPVDDPLVDMVPPVESPPKVIPKIVLGLKSASAKRDKPVATISTVSAFVVDEPVEAKPLRAIVPIDYTEDERLAGASVQQRLAATVARINSRSLDVKSLIEQIPTETNALFAYPVDWAAVTQHHIVQDKMAPWVTTKVTEYLGEAEATMVEFILAKLQQHASPRALVDELQLVLDDDAEVFVKLLWRKLAFEAVRCSASAL